MDTLVRDPFFEIMPSFFSLTLDEMLQVKHPRAWIEFELGRIDEAGYLERFFQDGRSFDTAAFTACIRRSYHWLNGMEGLLAELRAQGYEMHALSNYPVWYRWIEECCGVSRYLAWSFVSCNTGLRKPAPGAFLHAARSVDRSPDGCVFIDDRLSNCQAAESVGMPAIHFDGDVARLRKALAARTSIPLVEHP